MPAWVDVLLPMAISVLLTTIAFSFGICVVKKRPHWGSAFVMSILVVVAGAVPHALGVSFGLVMAASAFVGFFLLYLFMNHRTFRTIVSFFFAWAVYIGGHIALSFLIPGWKLYP